MTPEDARLVATFLALGNLNRLAILRTLRTPRTLGEIVVANDGIGPPIARQTVRRHLDELLDAALARAIETAEEASREYVVDHQRIYSLAEEVRGLAQLRPTLEAHADTATLAPGRPSSPEGPCLVVVKGLQEGRRYPLDASAAGSRWTIGRRRSASISVDFDAATSAENAEIRWDGAAHVVRDLPGSKNGTMVNFSKLEPGRGVPLRHGDIIGVGRCLFVYWR